MKIKEEKPVDSDDDPEDGERIVEVTKAIANVLQKIRIQGSSLYQKGSNSKENPSLITLKVPTKVDTAFKSVKTASMQDANV